MAKLPITYQEVKTSIKYRRDVIVLEDDVATLNSKDFELQLEKESKKEEVYLERGRLPKKKVQQAFNKSHSGDRKDNRHHPYGKDSAVIAKDSDDCSTDGELVSFSESSMSREWILNSGCT
uniref:Uncharacterized protein n=1 Tax=Cannabis sativa TaxID=3483 RepID=A0A803NP79_CANSA